MPTVARPRPGWPRSPLATKESQLCKYIMVAEHFPWNHETSNGQTVPKEHHFLLPFNKIIIFRQMNEVTKFPL
jgi:hypothetical protein